MVMIIFLSSAGSVIVQSWASLVIMMIFLIVHEELAIGDYYDDEHSILDVIFDTLKFR